MNNSKIILIPFNSQIIILKILSAYINKVRIVPYDFNKHSNNSDWLKELELKCKEVTDCLLNLSIVSWSWFKMISPLITTIYININKSYINNHKINKYSIIKPNNIKSLIIIINQINQTTYIKQLLRNLKFLKEIIINTDINNLNKYIVDIPFNNFTISNLIVNNTFNIIPYNLNKVYQVTITQEQIDKSILFQLFKKVKFSKLVIENNRYLNSIFKHINKNKTNSHQITTFDNTKSIEFNHFQPLETINNIIRISPNLNHLSIKLCYNNLIYCLSGNERDESYICKCTNNNSGSGSFESFTTQWNVFSNLIIYNNKKLKSFQLSNNCPFEPNNDNNKMNFANILSDSFIKNFSNVFIKNKTIRKLALYDLQPKVHDYIIINNTNISYYKSLV